ncbi:hypothetical protein SAMN06269185_0169 [Natronoarchaeum philippinense]|uniref:Uncharacterized protein n=1 Tax=Natronoarchaeum philippinense TaxID=558529 RepID=A0A285N2I4_NATPI|nr:hypothetical protein [Natronoarchaeum philippinense]SNZ03007.1 hypothetical protein SAMN06269185_0169 [Natronoarchaeum philippinense]
MSELATPSRLDGMVPDRGTLLLYAVALNTEVLVVLLYLLMTGSTLGMFGIYGMIWVTVGLWAIYRADPSPTDPRQRRIAAAIAGAYFLVLALIQGLIAPGPTLAAQLGLDSASAVDASLYATGFGTTIQGPPGLVPAVHYTGAYVDVTLLPTYAIGYGALAYLVYATIIDAARASVSGLLGLVSCVSCTWPVIASLIAGVTGGSASALTGVASALGFGASTAVFVLTVTLLRWRPFAQ